MAPDIQERGKRKRVLIGAEYTSEYKNILFHFEITSIIRLNQHV